MLERRAASGGTWDLFRYPGIRSDSDMFTLGYRFKPWRGDKALADGPSILAYVRETAREYGIDEHIRYGYDARAASWDSDDRDVDGHRRARRRRTARSPATSCGRLTGYYDYEQGYRAGVPRRGVLRRSGDPPAALARGPRLRGQEGRRHRLAGHRGHPRPGAGRLRCRPRDDAAALPDVRPLAPRRGQGRAAATQAPAREARLRRRRGGRTSASRPASSSSASAGPG